MSGFDHQQFRRCSRGFTLIELLVVVGVIAVMAAVLFGALNGGSAAKLQSAQLMMTNLVTNARGLALSSGRRTRILVHADVSSAQPAGRFLHFVAMQQRNPDGVTWTTIKTFELPDGVYVVPLSPRSISGLVGAANGTAANDWTLPSDPNTELGSTLFAGESVPVDLGDGMPAVSFQGVQITERGTLSRLDNTFWPYSSTARMVLVAVGQPKAPGAFGAGTSPVALPDSNGIRGAFVSNYAVPFQIQDKESL